MTTRKALELLAHARRAAATVLASLGVVLLPKCPLCVAAYLTSVGVSAGAAAFAAPLLRPAAAALGVAAIGALLLGWWRAKRYAVSGRGARAAPPTTPEGKHCCASPAPM